MIISVINTAINGPKLDLLIRKYTNYLNLKLLFQNEIEYYHATNKAIHIFNTQTSFKN